MVYEGGEYSTEDLFLELRRRVNDENIKSYDQYKDLVDLLVEEKKNYGFYSDDEDLEQLKRDLEVRWWQIKRE